jgi:chromatin segregation and condensation protein Rec8/ScpA/Scc1 (kleisin family)
LFGSDFSRAMHDMNTDVAFEVLKGVKDPRIIGELLFVQAQIAHQSRNTLSHLKNNDLTSLDDYNATLKEYKAFYQVHDRLNELSEIRRPYITTIINIAKEKSPTIATQEEVRHLAIRRRWASQSSYAEFLIAERETVLAWERLQLKPLRNGDISHALNYVSYLALQGALNLSPLFEQWAKAEASKVFSRTTYLH